MRSFGSTDLASRIQSVRVGARLTAAAAAAGMAYAAATWSGLHRTPIVALFLVAAAVGYLPVAYGAERVVRASWRELFFFLWTSSTIALTAALTWLDGGARSPLALLFFIPVVFVGLSYPQRSVVAIGAIDVLAFVSVGVASGSSQATLTFFATCLAVVALLCAWAALDHERQRDALNRVSRADPLTGCLNRRGFEERMAAELDSCRRGDRRAGLIVLDLDDFKQVNDTSGHEAGDELLRWTVDRAGEVLRPMDSLGRLGGDEFAVLVPGTGARGAREVAARLRDALGERVSVSAGVAAFPFDGADRDSLHRRADHDLYEAKRRRVLPPDARSSAVAAHAAAIAQRLGWSGAELSLLRMAATLHDVGKVSVSDRILQKPGPLTPAEFEEVKAHPLAGAEIVQRIDGLSPVADWIRHSHEHVDGSGYPDGLAGDEIPEASRILLVAEAFAAMTSRRAYGPPLSLEEALDELRLNAGAQFDGDCVDALEQHVGLPVAA
jgi:diguanylate cyclase (GGDEF)-like protein